MAGFIQFEPNVRDANSRQVVDVVVKAVGSGGKNVRLTIWPELLAGLKEEGIELSKGLGIMAEGKFTQNNVDGKQYLNLSVTELAVLPTVRKSTGDVEDPVADDDVPF